MTHAAMKDLVKKWRDDAGAGYGYRFALTNCADELSAALSAMEGEAVAWSIEQRNGLCRGGVFRDKQEAIDCGVYDPEIDVIRPLIYGDTAPPPQQAEKCEACNRTGPAPSEWVPYACKTCNRLPLIHPTPSPGPQGGGDERLMALADRIEAWTREPFVSLTEMRQRDVAGFVKEIRTIATPPAHQPGEVDMELVEEGLRYFELSGDKGDERYAREIRKAFAALAPKEAGHDR